MYYAVYHINCIVNRLDTAVYSYLKNGIEVFAILIFTKFNP